MANGRRIGSWLCAAAVAGLVTGGLTLNTAKAEEGPNSGAVSVSGGFDIVSEYWFRGIPQEDQGFLIQPYLDVAFDLAPLGAEGVSLYFGTWGSVHENDTPGVAGGNSWFEQDLYTGISVDLPYNLSADLSYIILYGPAFGGIFAEEIDFSLAWDDSGMWGDGFMASGLQPYVTFAFETDGGSDGFGNNVTPAPLTPVDTGSLGIYLELGIEPSWTLIESEDYPVTFSMPITVGFGLDDYYEYVDGAALAPGAVEDESFGFFSIGFMFSTPLSFVPAEYGSWSAYTGVTVLVINEDYASNAFNGAAGGAVLPGQDYSDDDIRGIFSFGISFEY